MSDSKSDATMNRLLEEGIKPHAEEVARICLEGGIACVVFEPGPEWQHALRSHGWNGEPVFALPAKIRERLAKSDHVTKRWVERKFKGGRRASRFRRDAQRIDARELHARPRLEHRAGLHG
jgi:hypothetical protein